MDGVMLVMRGGKRASDGNTPSPLPSSPHTAVPMLLLLVLCSWRVSCWRFRSLLADGRRREQRRARATAPSRPRSSGTPRAAAGAPPPSARRPTRRCSGAPPRAARPTASTRSAHRKHSNANALRNDSPEKAGSDGACSGSVCAGGVAGGCGEAGASSVREVLPRRRRWRQPCASNPLDPLLLTSPPGLRGPPSLAEGSERRI